MKIPEIQSHIDWITQRPDYLASISKRAEPFLYLVVSEVEKEQMPIEIALLPIVESDYYPFHILMERQLEFGNLYLQQEECMALRKTWWHEDRRDVLASTKAAVHYLKDLNQMFEGDWLLSIAAYNAGPGRVQRAIDKNIKQARKLIIGV